MLLDEILEKAYRNEIPVKIGFTSGFVYCGLLCENYKTLFNYMYEQDMNTFKYAYNSYLKRLKRIGENHPDYEKITEIIAMYKEELEKTTYLRRELLDVYASIDEPETMIILVDGIKHGSYWTSREKEKDKKLRELIERLKGEDMQRYNVRPKRHYKIMRKGVCVGESWAVSPEKAINNWWWKNIKGENVYSPREYSPIDFTAVEN